jgi:hypothetical protein
MVLYTVLMFLIRAASILDMTTVTPQLVFMLVLMLAIGYILDGLYVTVTSQAAASKGPEDGNVLANLRHWIAKFLVFSHTPENQPGVPSVPEISGQVYELPELGAAGGNAVGTFRNLVSHMVGVDMAIVITFLHCYFFSEPRPRINVGKQPEREGTLAQ